MKRWELCRSQLCQTGKLLLWKDKKPTTPQVDLDIVGSDSNAVHTFLRHLQCCLPSQETHRMTHCRTLPCVPAIRQVLHGSSEVLCKLLGERASRTERTRLGMFWSTGSATKM